MLRLALVLAGLALLLAASGIPADAQQRPPNVVVIFTDDLGYGDLGVFGHPTIRTPHLDRMAREGMKLTSFYSAASVCTPSRAGLLTGRYPVRSGMTSDQIRVLFPTSALGLPHSEVTLAEALRAEGYATAAVGKWHLGHMPAYLPLRHGFDTYFGVPYSNDMSPAQNEWAGTSIYPPTPLIRDSVAVEEEPDQRLLTRRYTEEALAFIDTHQDEPFFLYLAHTFPHVPLYASEAFEGQSPRGLYGDVVEELDWSTGQILDRLRTLGLDQNTLVVFTSDNGPWLTKDEEGGSAGLLRNGKGTTWEGGMRVPTLAWWPGVIEPATVSHALASTLDLLPTAVALAGGALPEDRAVDGVDLMPLLRGEASEVRDAFFYYRGSRLWAVRKGPWKMHLRTQSAYVGDEPVEHDPPQLYHLEHDPGERFDVAPSHPEVLAELQALIETHQATVEVPPSQLEVKLDTYESFFGGN